MQKGLWHLLFSLMEMEALPLSVSTLLLKLNDHAVCHLKHHRWMHLLLASGTY